ncbi:MAG: ATP-dependent DNA helicase RecG [Planctomycetota bacterium]
MGNIKLNTEVQYIKGVGPKRAEAFAKKDIRVARDLLFTFPRKYRDFTKIVSIDSLRDGDEAVVRGRILKSHSGNPFSKVKHKVMISDNTGVATAIWFQKLNGLDSYRTGDEVYISGKVFYRAGFTFAHPVIERVESESLRAGKIAPIYPEVEGLGDASWQRIMDEALKCAGELKEILPHELLTAHNLPSRSEAIREIHQPRSTASLKAARDRFVYEEFFIIQTSAALRRQYMRSVSKRNAKKITPLIEERIRARFPFEFTNAQKRVIAEIIEDMTSSYPMNRLLQGDVGSGKTAVALCAALLTVANKQQAAMLVPTDVLAQQHYSTVEEALRNSKVRIALLTGSMSAYDRDRVRASLSEGNVDIIVGTHALLTEAVEFENLGLAVIDEQHRFGVAQRAELRRKGIAVDTLVMTATPIPRTLAMTLFGDLDVSIIDELPPGRKPVRTLRFPLDDESRAHSLVLEELKKGGQAFIVCPLIEGSDTEGDDLRSAISVYERLSATTYRNHRVGLAHGKMSATERELVLDRFRAGEIQVLVSTVIIEVGIDVPNATVMLIEHAERFGLATLHQLRGRVGRGRKLSYCLCVADLKSEEARNRLEIFCSTTDGFKIAEEDLKLRGPGEVLGTRQHGTPALRWGSLTDDFALLKIARQDAFSKIAAGWRPDDEFRAEISRYGLEESLATVG